MASRPSKSNKKDSKFYYILSALLLLQLIALIILYNVPIVSYYLFGVDPTKVVATDATLSSKRENADVSKDTQPKSDVQGRFIQTVVEEQK